MRLARPTTHIEPRHIQRRLTMNPFELIGWAAAGGVAIVIVGFATAIAAAVIRAAVKAASK
ncbi:MAG: hypothetical protein ACJLS2_02515 [Microcella pacifica]